MKRSIFSCFLQSKVNEKKSPHVFQILFSQNGLTTVCTYSESVIHLNFHLKFRLTFFFLFLTIINV